MHASRRLGICGAFAVLCGRLYVTVASLTPPVAPGAQRSQVTASGEGEVGALAALRHEIGSLRAELAALRRQERSVGTLPSEFRQFQKDVRAVRQQVQDIAVRPQVAHSNTRASEPHATATTTAPQTPADREERAQQQQQRHVERMQVLETRWQRDPLDPQWSTATTDFVDQVLARDEFQQTQVMG